MAKTYQLLLSPTPGAWAIIGTTDTHAPKIELRGSDAADVQRMFEQLAHEAANPAAAYTAQQSYLRKCYAAALPLQPKKEG